MRGACFVQKIFKINLANRGSLAIVVPMTKNYATNYVFLSAITAESRNSILGAIAANYGITLSEAYDEVTHDEAEHILDYLTGATRAAASALMQKHGMR